MIASKPGKPGRRTANSRESTARTHSRGGVHSAEICLLTVGPEYLPDSSHSLAWTECTDNRALLTLTQCRRLAKHSCDCCCNISNTSCQECTEELEAVASKCILSDSPCQWLTDAIIANGLDLLPNQLPTVRLSYPAPLNGLNHGVANIFHGSNLRKAMAGKSVTTSIFQIFGAHSHWHALIFAIMSKVLFYFEPYGGALQSPSPIQRQFSRYLEPEGWTLTSLRVRLQSDGHSCGI